MSTLLEGREDQIPTNHDCIKELYDYETEDDLTIPDELHYRWCKPPGSAPELIRRHKHRERRFEYFHRPAIKRGNLWFPDRYLPDPEDPEWSWKEGLELDKPAQSAYQLNKGCCFWDPSKHF